MTGSMHYTFTVFTPTFNRAHLLGRVHESLRQQTFRDFEWLIVDDGSTDDTGERVEAWQRENDMPIRYFWQKNAHKKVAFNHGVREAHGELFLTLDSDDELLPDALETLQRVWTGIPERERPRYSAVTGLCVYPDGRVVGERFPADVLDSDSLEMYHRHHVRGEKFGFQRTDVLRRFPFPEDVQGLVPEGIVWSAIARAGYRTRYVNEVVRVYHQTEDSLIRGRGRQILSVIHAQGRALSARDALTNDLGRWFRVDPFGFVKEAGWYVCCRLHLLRQGKNGPPPLEGIGPRLLVMSCFPLGVALYLRDLWRSR